MAFDYILFDLDGTLTDSGPGIMNAVAYAFRQMGVEAWERERLRCFIGPPLSDAFVRFCGMDEAQALEAVRQFRVYYRETGLFENEPYPGIHTFLNTLCAQGKHLAVATSKPMEMTLQVLERFELSQYFEVVCAGSLDESRNKKWQIVEDALRQLGAEDSARALMVGDREQDVVGAHKNGLKCAGVLWGYGSREEFEGVETDYIVCDYEELMRVISA